MHRLRELKKVTKTRDFVDEIKKTWQIKGTKIKIHYEVALAEVEPHTEMRLDEKGQLHLTIFAHPKEDKIIIFHEGAHVYLSYIGYPSLEFANRPQYEPDFGEGSIDFINEYYAGKLELSKIGKTPDECAEELNELAGECYDTIEDPVRIAIWTQILSEYDPVRGANAIHFGEDYGSDFGMQFSAILTMLKEVPPLPEPPNRFTESYRSKITQLLEQACETVYNGRCVLKPPGPYPHSRISPSRAKYFCL